MNLKEEKVPPNELPRKHRPIGADPHRSAPSSQKNE